MGKIVIPAEQVEQLVKMSKDLVEAPLDRKTFITGFPKSGSRYIWQVLEAAGFDAAHESVSAMGLWRRNFDIDSSCYTVAMLPVIGNGKLVHLVRNPVDAINSVLKLYDHQEKKENFHTECRVFGVIKKPLQLQLCDLWVYTNRVLEDLGAPRVRVDVESDVKDLLENLGVRYGIEPHWVEGLPRNENENKLLSKPVTWNNISDECQRMAERYGYSA